MKNALWTGFILIIFAVAFVSGLIVQQHFGVIDQERVVGRYSPEEVLNLSKSSYIEGYYSGSEAALKGRFKAAGDEQYKEALTWRLDHPDFPFILEKEPGQ